MTVPKVLLVGERLARPVKVADVGHTARAWELLGWVGLVFAAVGLLDVALAWLPPMLGDPQWEFGTISQTLVGLPLPSLGLALFLAAGIARDRRWQVRLAGVAMGALLLLVLASALLYLTVLPLALREVTEPVARTGLLKSTVKSLALLVVYPPLFGGVAYVGWRRSRAG